MDYFDGPVTSPLDHGVCSSELNNICYRYSLTYSAKCFDIYWTSTSFCSDIHGSQMIHLIFLSYDQIPVKPSINLKFAFVLIGKVHMLIN